MNIVITGGTKGIGKATAKRFATEGWNVAICSRHTEDLKSFKEELQDLNDDIEVITEVVDVSKKVEVVAFGKRVLTTLDNIDVLVNNAGIFIPGSVHKEEEGALELQIETNLYSAYHLTRSLLPSMMERQQGHIFNLCSTASLTAYANGGAYSISKFALLGFSKNLREEMKPYHIKVTSLCPGATMTASWEGAGIPAERIMKADDVAEIIWTAVQLSPQAVMEEIILRPLAGDLG